jgi:quercetin dioxygenase-like cupin family protein
MRTSLLFAAAMLAAVPAASHAEQAFSSADLLDTGKTVLGETLVYPTSGPARLHSMIVTVSPDRPAKLHHHPTPMYAYILEGELTIDYGAAGKHTFKAGDAFVEAVNTPHQGIDIRMPVRILTVSMGVEGMPNVVVDKPATAAE